MSITTLAGESPKVLPKLFSKSRVISTVTRAVFDDEPCFLLGEFNLMSRSGMSQSRYQLLRVVRDDRLVTAHIYLGPARKFEADQFTMLGGVIDDNGRGQAVHTVGELRDGAERIRATKPRREQEPSDLTGAFKNYAEEKLRRRAHRSTFGSGVMMVR